MRFTKESIPLSLLLLLPLYSCLFSWGPSLVLLALVSIFITREAILINSLISKKRKDKEGGSNKDRGLKLNTHCYSHFSEKVRWCMDYIGAKYVEEQDCASLGLLLSGRWVPTLSKDEGAISISNSSDILRYFYATRHEFGNPERQKLLSDFLSPTEEALELEKKFDAFGEEVKKVGYATLFFGSSSNPKELPYRVLGLRQAGSRIPRWQKHLTQQLFPLIKYFIVKRVGVSPESALAARESVRKTLNEVGELLSDGRRFLLGTDRPTFVDFHFAAMASMALLPEGLAGSALDKGSRIELKDIEDLEVAGVVQEFRGTRAGQFAMRMYREYRMGKVWKEVATTK